MIERRGLTLVGIAVGNLDDGERLQLELPFDRRSRAELTPRSIRCATATGRRP